STGFSRDTLEYAAVIYSFDTITVNATAEDSNVSAITVNGSGTVSGGSVSQATPLSAGKGYVTDIAIVVTAEDGSTQQTYTIHAKLLSIHEYYWGVYGPPMTKSYDKWQPKPTFSDKTVNGEVSGNLYWEIKSVSGGIRNYMNLTDYNDGKYDIDYNDNGFVANGELQAVLVSMGGTQTGTYTLTSPWGDSLASMDYHLTIKSADKVVGPDSYTTCNYMGESEVMFYTGDTAPYPFESGYNWYESWPDPQP
ncbi:MAG: cadherin-like beta sandwich domain-containing protein, partial [bacterium]|nr:cadherin-like beta sandwich domain-containing protein [bacterium]